MHVFRCPRPIVSAIGKFENTGTHVYFLDDVRPIQSEDDLLYALQVALKFPGWYGMNWNATVDCLREHFWGQNSRALIVWLDASRLLSSNSRVVDLFAEIIEETNTEIALRNKTIDLVIGGCDFVLLNDHSIKGIRELCKPT